MAGQMTDFGAIRVAIAVFWLPQHMIYATAPDP